MFWPVQVSSRGIFITPTIMMTPAVVGRRSGMVTRKRRTMEKILLLPICLWLWKREWITSAVVKTRRVKQMKIRPILLLSL